MRRPPETAERDDRALSEVLGAVLMTALVIVVMTVAASAIVPRLAADGDSGPPLVDCEVTYDGELLVTHAGGHDADVDDLSVVLRDGSGSPTRLPFVVDEGDGDDWFEVDETARLGTLADRTEVLLVTGDAIVCEAVVYPTTPTASPTPVPTPTAAPTPTSTSPTNQPPVAEFTSSRVNGKVSLDARDSTDDGRIVSYEWYVGGTVDSTPDYTGQKVTNEEIPSGTEVTLVVTDAEGSTDRVTKTV